MGILTVVFPRRFTVLEDGRPIAEMRFAWLSRESDLLIGDTAYKACQEHSGYGFSVLKEKERVRPRATSVRTLFHDSCLIAYAGRRYQLCRVSFSMMLAVCCGRSGHLRK